MRQTSYQAQIASSHLFSARSCRFAPCLYQTQQIMPPSNSSRDEPPEPPCGREPIRPARPHPYMYTYYWGKLHYRNLHTHTREKHGSISPREAVCIWVHYAGKIEKIVRCARPHARSTPRFFFTWMKQIVGKYGNWDGSTRLGKKWKWSEKLEFVQIA